MMKKYFTTPIYYVNDIPHIGHAYCTLATDTLVRYWRQKIGDENVFFSTGTDENSQKTVDAAKKAGQPIDVYLEGMAKKWRETWDEIGISYNDFIRTTEERHIETVQNMLQTIMDKGDIYKGMYRGKYCTGCETFLKDSELDEDGNCPAHKKPPVELEEENYFFKLSKYEDQLLDWYEKNPEQLLPGKRKNEVLQFIKDGLDDVSVSRETAEFGIEMPQDALHKIYVWFDALINYYTSIQPEDRQEFWHDVTHIVGKDITRFHCIIWPAMLISAGIPLPTKVFAHGFFTIDGEKMSKSIGNVISPVMLSEKYGNDALRTGILSSFEFGNDGDFSLEHFDQFYSTKLAGGVGNLFNRVSILIHKFLDGKITVEKTERGTEIKDTFNDLIENYKIKGAIDHFFATVDEANQYMNDTEVWKLAKVNPDAAKAVFIKLYEYLMVLYEMSAVILPETSEKMKDILGADGKLGEPVILFPRIED